MRTSPFRGSVAVAAGLVTAAELRGPRFRRLLRDVYVPADVEPDLAVRSRGAALLGGVLAGWSAAELLGASCGPADAPVEIVVSRRRREQHGLIVRHATLAADEVTHVAGVPVTTPARTAYDLARRLPLVEAVVAVDALARAGRIPPEDVVAVAARYPGARGRRALPAVVALADPRAGSPMETRLRLAIASAGLPLPTPQHPVGPYLLDLAYPSVRLGVEHDGPDHLTPVRHRRDLDREAYLGRLGWYVLRFPARDVLLRPERVADRVRERLFLAARGRGVALHELALP